MEDFSGQTKIKLFLCAGLRYLFFAAVTEPLQNQDYCWVFVFFPFFFLKSRAPTQKEKRKKLVRWGREIKRALQTHNLKSASIMHYAFASVTVGCFTDTRSVLDCRRFNNGKLGLINNRCSSERRKLSLTETLIHCKPYGAFLCNKPPQPTHPQNLILFARFFDRSLCATKRQTLHFIFELFFYKKIPLSRRVEYVTGQWVSE